MIDVGGSTVFFSLSDLQTIRAEAPSLCGRCSVCALAGDIDERLREYLANRDSEDPISGAIIWLRTAYPECVETKSGKLHASTSHVEGRGWVVACGHEGSWLTFDVVSPGFSIAERFLWLRGKDHYFSRHGIAYVGTTCDGCFEAMLKGELSITTPELLRGYKYILFREV